MLYSVLALTVAVGLFLDAWSTYQHSLGMTDAERCVGIDRAQSLHRDCLFEVVGLIVGPHHQKGAGSNWGVVEPGDRDRGDIEEVTVGTLGSLQLEAATDGQVRHVVGLLWHGSLVAFDVDGQLVESDDYGARSWTLPLLLGLVLLSVFLVLFCAGALHKLIEAFSRRHRPTAQIRRMTDKTARNILAPALTIGGAALIATVPLGFGLPLWLVYAAFAGTTVLVSGLFHLTQPK